MVTPGYAGDQDQALEQEPELEAQRQAWPQSYPAPHFLFRLDWEIISKQGFFTYSFWNKHEQGSKPAWTHGTTKAHGTQEVNIEAHGHMPASVDIYNRTGTLS